MFKGDDDDDGEGSVGATRYACMPSLVALQQMRNRLHMAQLGKKLMKWTAVATGKELRRLAYEIVINYKTFGEDVRNAFILLARCRYFYPNMNQMVLENVPKGAAITVSTHTKAISGVKVLHLKINDTGEDPYQHLGIEKGGQIIAETKEAWRNLLKRIILTLDLKKCFQQVDEAHRNATKKQNVLGKVVIPRSNASISYIIDELEEIAREEFFRLKKMLEHKQKRLKKHVEEEQDITCPTCPTCPICLKTKEQDTVFIEKCFICEAVLHSTDNLLEKTPKEKTFKDTRLEEFKAHITEFVDFTRAIEEKGIVTASVEEFLKTAEEFRDKLEMRGEEVQGVEPIPSDVPLNKLCHLCLERFKEQQAAKEKPEKGDANQEMSFIESSEKVKIEKHPITPGVLCEMHAQVETDLELGTFETEIKESTKIIRVKNNNGTVTEERKIVKIKKEIRSPIKPNAITSQFSTTNSNVEAGKSMYQASDSSSKLNPYPSNKTIQTVIINLPNIFDTKPVKSDIYLMSSPMIGPLTRSCLSSISMLSHLTYLEVCECASCENLSKETLVNLVEPCTEFEYALKPIEASTSNCEPSNICKTTNERNIIHSITNSERELVDNLPQGVRISKSTYNVSKKVINNRVLKSVPLNTKE